MNLSLHYPLLVIVVLFSGAYLTPLLGLWNKKICFPLAIVSSLVSALLSVGLLFLVLENETVSYYVGGWEPPYGIELKLDPLSSFLSLVVAIVGFLAIIFSKRYAEHEISSKKQPAYYSLLQLIIGGMQGALMTGDLFNLFVMTEIFSISGYALVAIAQKKGSLLASFRYLLLASIGTTFVLFSTGFIYILTGSLNMEDISNLLPLINNPWVMYSGLVLLIIGFAIKSALFPLHTWLPDAHSIAPSPVSVLLSALVIKIGAYSIIRIVYTVFGEQLVGNFGLIGVPLSWMASLAILVGSLYAIFQTDIKRMLAYSSIAHIGYILLGVSIGSTLSLTGGIFHMLNHAFGKACLFFCAGAVIYKTGIRNIADYAGLSSKMPITMAAFVIAASSLMGVPPASGFMSKFYLGLGAYQEHWIFLTVILIGSLLSGIYFFRVVSNAYFSPDKSSEIITQGPELPLSMLIPIIVLALASLSFGILEDVPVTLIEQAVQLLLPN